VSWTELEKRSPRRERLTVVNDTFRAPSATYASARRQRTSYKPRSSSTCFTKRGSVSRLISLCITDDCREEAENLLSRAVPAPTIRVHGPGLPRGEPRFFVESATQGMCESRDALRRWLLLHPPGTRFVWGPPMSSFPWSSGSLWFPGEVDAYFEEVRTFLEGQAMSLVQET